MPDPRPETAACGCRTFRNDGAGWYCDTHGNPRNPETMADATDDTARHSDQLLRRAEDWHLNVRVNYLNVRVSDPPSLQAAFDIVGKLMAQVRYWRGAYHETISRLDRHTDEHDRYVELRRAVVSALNDLDANVTGSAGRYVNGAVDHLRWLTRYVPADTDRTGTS